LNTIFKGRVPASVVLAGALLNACGGGSGGAVAPPERQSALAVVGAASATFAGPRASYTITRTSDGYTVVDSAAARDGTVQVGPAVQSLIFTDYTVNLVVGDKAATIAAADLKSLVELYIAYFNRVPDADGLSFWIDQVRAGQSLDQIGESFYSVAVSAAFSALTGYSAGMSNADFVTVIYRNVLGRSSPDAEGLAYWTTSLANGSQTRGTLVRTILASAHGFKGDATFGSVADLLDNKYALSASFTIKNGLGYVSATDAVSKGMQLAAAVASGGISAAQTLIGVNDSGLDLTRPAAPGAPGIASVSAGNGSAVIAFVAPSGNGGAPIVAFTAFCAAAGSQVAVNGTSSPITVAPMSNGLTYNCVVSATNSAGSGASSGAVAVTPVAPAVVITPPVSTVSVANGRAYWSQGLGRTGYACADCHGNSPATNINNVLSAAGSGASQGDPAVISNAIAANRAGMGDMATLNAAQLADLAAYINAVRYGK
jgi:hypothetical protein